MAESKRFVCSNCAAAVEVWSDGNPYYIDLNGEKQYAYHPDHERLAMCVGNDSPHICLGCGEEFNVDSEAPIAACAKCGSSEISDTWNLDSKTCPYCCIGKFSVDPDFFAIS